MSSTTLIPEPDIYEPITVEGKIVDHVPSFANHPQGIRCNCSNKCYTSRTLLNAHIKTGIHKKWIEDLNSNSTNLHSDLEKERQLVKEQKIIIARKDQEIVKLKRDQVKFIEHIHFLTSIMNSSSASASASTSASSQSVDTPSQIDLIDFN
jgi:hypothetical protein